MMRTLLPLATLLFCLSANLAQADSANSPYFGSELTGLYQPTNIVLTDKKQASANVKLCNDFICPQAIKAPISNNQEKRLP